MSIYGTWTAKHYFAKTLQDYLPTEVAAINTEDPAGVVLTVPTTADVVTYSVAGEGQQWPFTVAPILFEVLCDTSTVTEWALAEMNRSLLTMEHEVDLRISVRDSATEGGSILREKLELYVAACDRVVAIERIQLGYAAGVNWCVPVSCTYRNTDWDKAVAQATRRYIVRTREVNT